MVPENMKAVNWQYTICRRPWASLQQRPGLEHLVKGLVLPITEIVMAEMALQGGIVFPFR